MGLAYLTLPFALGIAALLIRGQTAGGWERLDHVIYAAAVLALWVVAVAIRLGWSVIALGWRWSELPSVAILVVAALVLLRWAALR